LAAIWRFCPEPRDATPEFRNGRLRSDREWLSQAWIPSRGIVPGDLEFDNLDQISKYHTIYYCHEAFP
jgi:hypothetical protein